MPFAGYKDFADCVAKNSGKEDPKAYCGSIEAKVKKARSEGLNEITYLDPEELRQPMDFAENLDNLRKAFVALKAAYTSYGEYDAPHGLRYAISDLKRMITDEWVAKQAMGLAAADLKLESTNAATLEALNHIRSAVASMHIGDDPDGDAVIAQRQAIAVTESMIRENIAEVEALVVETEKIPVELFSEANIYSTESTLLIAEGSQPEQNKFRMAVIREGMSGNRVEYKQKFLLEATPLLSNRPMYMDHPAGIAEGRPQPRSMKDKIGLWTDPTYVENLSLPSGEKFTGITATANLFENTAYPWFPALVKESLVKGMPNAVGVSVVIAGKFSLQKDAGGSYYKRAESVTHFLSADAVAEPGAGGQPLSIIAASKGVDPDVMEREELEKALKEMSAEDLKKLRPDLASEGAQTPGTDTPTTPQATTPTTPAPEGSPAVVAEMETMVKENQTLLEQIKQQQTEGFLREILRGVKLSDKAVTAIESDVLGKVMSREDVQAIVTKYAELHQSALESLPGYSDQIGRNLGPGIIPWRGPGATDGQITAVESVSLALDDFFGSPIPDDKKGKFHRIFSIAEFYRNLTGDAEVRGEYNRGGALFDVFEKATFAEALPGATHVVGGGTITMSNLLGTSMNRALFNFYKGQNKWWEDIVEKVPLANLKQQDRVRLHNFGSLTERTVDGAEYTELDWGETAETYTPTEFGNVVTVGRRAIINDDLRGIRAIPRLLGQSAGVTINERHSLLFTQNAGLGPTLADTKTVFHADHQTNTGTDQLSRAALIAASKVIMKMTNDASKRMQPMPEYLLVPIDMYDTAHDLLMSVQIPGSANNEPNVLASSRHGLKDYIVVPNWTDPNNWYLMAGPSQFTSIETGFLFGREEPEMFEQSNPSVGMVFTNDVMAFKIRHDYGQDWIDYRGAYGSIAP